MKQIWKATDIENAIYIGSFEVHGEHFEILETKNKFVFGTACNAGFLESGYMELEEGETGDAALLELYSDLDAYYQDGYEYVSRIVCNERM